MPSQASTSLPRNSNCSTSKSKTLVPNVIGKTPAPAAVLALISNALQPYPLGLRVKKLQTLLLTSKKYDLEKFSLAQGYKDALEFLEHQMPKLKIDQRENRLDSLVKLPVSCNPMPSQASTSLPSDSNGSASKSKTLNQNVVGKKSDPTAVLALISNVLKAYPLGLRVMKLQTLLLTAKRCNLEKFSLAQGYKDTLEFLEHQMPELKIERRGNRLDSLVKLPVSCDPMPSQASTSLPSDSNCSTSKSKSLDQNVIGKTPDLVAVLALISNILKPYPFGLRVRKLQTLLLTSKKYDLEKFSLAQGYTDTLEFLEHRMPELKIERRGNRLDSLVNLPVSCNLVLSQASTSLSSDPNCSTSKSETLDQNVIGMTPASPSSASSQPNTSLSLDPERSASLSKTLDPNVQGLRPVSCDPMPSQASTSLPSDSNCSTSKSKTLDQNVVGKKSANIPSPSSSSSQPNPSFSLDSEHSASISKTLDPNVQGQRPANIPSPSSSSSQPNTSLSLNSECSVNISKTLDPNLQGQRPDQAEVLALTTDVLSRYAVGLRVKKLQTLLLTLEEFDLEKFSIAQGYRDTLEFLEHRMPELKIEQCENRLNSLVKLPGGGKKKEETEDQGSQEKMKKAPAKVLALISDVLKPYLSGLRVKKLQALLLTVRGFDLEKFSVAQGYKDTVEFLEHQMPDLKIEQREDRLESLVKYAAPAEVLALISNILNLYTTGLRVKKLQTLLLTSERFDLEKFSIAQGYKDALHFLEQQIPELMIKIHKNRLNCLVKLSGGGKKEEETEGQGSQEKMEKSLSGPDVKSIPPLLERQKQLEPTRTLEPPKAAPGTPFFSFGDFSGLDTLAPLQGGLWCRTPVPSTMIPNHLSSKEHHSASSGGAMSSSKPNSDIQAQQSSACQFGGPPPARELSCPVGSRLPSQLSQTELPHSEDLSLLKQQVASILAMHPEGMSLFQFRAAYSTTYQHPLPLGNASSAKQHLLEMSDIVCMKGYGVQMLLLPVSPEEPPAKSGLPVISSMENAATVPAVALPKAVVLPTPSLPGSPVQPHPCAVGSRALDHLRAPDVEENCVLPEEQHSRASRTVAPLQSPVRPRDNLGGHPGLCKSEAATDPCSLPKAVVKVKPVVVPKSSSLKTPVEPQSCSTCPLASDHLRIPDNKENCVVPKGPPLRTPEMVASVRPKASFGGQPDISKEVAMDLGYASPKVVMTIEPVVLPKSSLMPSLSKTEEVPVPQLHPSSPWTSSCLRAPANQILPSFLPEMHLSRPPKPVAPLGEKVQARVISRDTLSNHCSPMIFPEDPHVTRPHGNWTSDGLASRPTNQAIPSISVPAPFLFQPVFNNFVAMAQPVVHPAVIHLPEALGNPSLGSPSHQAVSRTHLQESELVSPPLAQPAPQRRPAQPAPPIRLIRQADCPHTAHRLEPLLRTSRKQGQSHSPVPVFSASEWPVSSPSVKPPSFQPPTSQSVKPPECVHHPWPHSMQHGSVPVADHSMTALPLAGAHSQPVTPTRQNRYVAMNSPVTPPRKPSSSPSHQPAPPSLIICTESDPESYTPSVSVPQPTHISKNSAVTSSSTQLSKLLTSPRGSPTSTANQPSYVSISAKASYDASCQRKPFPGMSEDCSEPDNHFTLPDNQKHHLKPKPVTPYPLQTRSAVEKTCVVL